MLRARSARAFDNVTKAKGPCTLEKTGEQLSNFLKAIKKNNGFIFSCPSKVAQLLLSIFAMYKTRESVQKFCSQFPRPGGPDNEKMSPAGISESFCQAQILNFLWLDFFGGRLRPDKGTQVPENSLKQFRKPKPQILISCGWIFLAAGCGQIRGRKSLKIP